MLFTITRKLVFQILCFLLPATSLGGTRLVVSDGLEDLYFKIKSQKTIGKVDALFRNLQRKSGFNGVVLISEDKHVLYKRAFGFANLSSREPLTTESRFQLASVSKQFTAVGIMMLKERGLIGYEDKVTKYYPRFPFPEVTIRQLLTHHAGLPDYRWFCDTLLENKETPLSNQDLMRMFEKHRPNAYFLAGSRFSYSNTGYAVLAAVIEQVSGIHFSKFMKLAVFDPLGMKNTQVYSKCECVATPGNVTGYERNGRWKAQNDCFNGITGDKNVYSTVDDLFRWDLALYTDKPVKQSTLREAFEPSDPGRKGVKNYGFGWRINTLNPEKKIVYHSGWWRGYRTFFLRNISDGNSIIVLSNTVNYSLNSLGYLYELIRENDLQSLNGDDAGGTYDNPDS